jgi:hypothetical protein
VGVADVVKLVAVVPTDKPEATVVALGMVTLEWPHVPVATMVR